MGRFRGRTALKWLQVNFRTVVVVEEIDGLLDKIARTGMDSLTPAEKAVLQRASARLKDSD